MTRGRQIHPSNSNSAHNIIFLQHSSRGDKFTGYACLKHGASVIGEGGRVEYTSGETMVLDLEAIVPCSSTDVQSLVNVTKYPLIGKV